MASVQQLEKLHHIQRMFLAGDSLEAAVAGERVQQIISRTQQLIKQREFLRDERRRLRISTEALAERQAALKVIKRDDWVPPQIIETTESKAKHVRINISGIMFEAPATVLRRDPKSLLAQLCSDDPPILPDPSDGFFYFDRDWWLFRYIMAFMRDGTLPDDRQVLALLYREASFWNLVEMQRAIEEEKLHLRPTTAVGFTSAAEQKRDKELWWRKLPSWWAAVDEAQKKEKDAAAVKKTKEDWWLDTEYKGTVFLPLSTAPDKVVTKPGEKDAKPNGLTGTWKATNTSSSNDNYDPYGYNGYNGGGYGDAYGGYGGGGGVYGYGRGPSGYNRYASYQQPPHTHSPYGHSSSSSSSSSAYNQSHLNRGHAPPLSAPAYEQYAYGAHSGSAGGGVSGNAAGDNSTSSGSSSSSSAVGGGGRGGLAELLVASGP